MGHAVSRVHAEVWPRRLREQPPDAAVREVGLEGQPGHGARLQVRQVRGGLRAVRRAAARGEREAARARGEVCGECSA